MLVALSGEVDVLWGRGGEGEGFLLIVVLDFVEDEVLCLFEVDLCLQL